MLTCNMEHLLTGSDRDVLIVPHLQRTVWTFWTCSGADEVQAPVEIFVASPAKPYISGIIVRAGHAFAAIVASSVWIQTPDISIWKTQCQVEQKPKLRAEAKQLCQILSSLNQHWDSLACFVLLCLALLCLSLPYFVTGRPGWGIRARILVPSQRQRKRLRRQEGVALFFLVLPSD